MRLAVLAALALSLNLSFVVGEAAAQTCDEDDPCVACVIAGKPGSKCCVNGKMSACIPALDESCGGKECAVDKVCVNERCVCDTGFTDCGGTCRDLARDTVHCGSCTNACPSGMFCQPSTPVVLGPSTAGPPVTPPVGVCACTPPTVSCGGVCRNPSNDPSNCGACGNVCAAPTTQCRSGQCVAPDAPTNTSSAGSTGNLPLDLFWSQTDPNGLPLNPDWRARSVPELVDGDDEHNDKRVNLARACPACVVTPACVAACQPDPSTAACQACLPRETCFQQCTRFPLEFDSGIFCGTHVNWMPVTYEGKLEFQDYTARGFLSSVFKDDDYTFHLKADHNEGAAGRPKLHPEMSFLETVADFQTTFWKNFRHLVDTIPGEDLSAPRALFNKPAIVIGLKGLDTQHGVHEELHPIFAMALRRTGNPRLDCWAVFARNWGNQGGCSSEQHPLRLGQITFRFPQPGATAVREASREFRTNSRATAVSEVGLVKDGAEITFFLGHPNDRTHVNGEICLRWSLPPGTPVPKMVAAAGEPNELELDREMHPGAELLTRAQAEQIRRSLPPRPARKKRSGMLVPKRVPFVPSSARPTAPGGLVMGRMAPDAAKQARDRQIHRLVCEALRSHPRRPQICDWP